MPKRERERRGPIKLFTQAARLSVCTATLPCLAQCVCAYLCVCVCVCNFLPPVSLKHLQLVKGRRPFSFFVDTGLVVAVKIAAGVNRVYVCINQSAIDDIRRCFRAGKMNSIQPTATIFCLSRASADKGSHQRGALEDG